MDEFKQDKARANLQVARMLKVERMMSTVH